MLRCSSSHTAAGLTRAGAAYPRLSSFSTARELITAVPNYHRLSSTPAQLRTSGMRCKRVVDNLPFLDSGIYSASLPSLAKLYSPASQPHIHGVTFLSGPHTFRYVRLRVPLDSASTPTRTQRQGRDVWRFHCKRCRRPGQRVGLNEFAARSQEYQRFVSTSQCQVLCGQSRR